MFFAGVVKVNINGKIDPRTRSLITNHLSLFDAPMICSIHPLCFVLMESLRSVWLLRKFGDVYGFIYVDRSVKCNTTEKIINTQNDPESPPLQVFPEGKVTNGDCIMGFRTGAFVNDTVIQPVTMRYNQYLIREDMATVSWLEDSILTYLYQYFSIPFMTLNINILDPIDFKGSKKTPQERAAEVQLIMANSLGCKAIKRTNKEIFQKPKAE